MGRGSSPVLIAVSGQTRCRGNVVEGTELGSGVRRNYGTPLCWWQRIAGNMTATNMWQSPLGPLWLCTPRGGVTATSTEFVKLPSSHPCGQGCNGSSGNYVGTCLQSWHWCESTQGWPWPWSQRTSTLISWFLKVVPSIPLYAATHVPYSAGHLVGLGHSYSAEPSGLAR